MPYIVLHDLSDIAQNLHNGRHLLILSVAYYFGSIFRKPFVLPIPCYLRAVLCLEHFHVLQQSTTTRKRYASNCTVTWLAAMFLQTSFFPNFSMDYRGGEAKHFPKVGLNAGSCTTILGPKG